MQIYSVADSIVYTVTLVRQRDMSMNFCYVVLEAVRLREDEA